MRLVALFSVLISASTFASLTATQSAKPEIKVPTDRLGDPLPKGARARLGALRRLGAEFDVHLYEAATGKLRRRLSGHDLPVRSLAFSPSGGLLASGSLDSTVLVWDVYSP
jgi:WD40 repeat protein